MKTFSDTLSLPGISASRHVYAWEKCLSVLVSDFAKMRVPLESGPKIYLGLKEEPLILDSPVGRSESALSKPVLNDPWLRAITRARNFDCYYCFSNIHRASGGF